MNGSRIAIAKLDGSTLLRFDDVGYFNRVYAQGDAVVERLNEIDDFFRGSLWGYRLLSPVLSDSGPFAEECCRRGYVPDESLVWLSGRCTVPPQRDRQVAIRPAGRDEAAAFFKTYLEAFDAAPERVAAAIGNMQHLFDEPSLHFLWALASRRPAGIGMLLHAGSAALLCAGAMLPAHRGLGGHEALLAARIELAQALGCSDVHSWAVDGGHSHANMERAGLRTVAVTRTWRRLPDDLR